MAMFLSLVLLVAGTIAPPLTVRIIAGARIEEPPIVMLMTFAVFTQLAWSAWCVFLYSFVGLYQNFGLLEVLIIQIFLLPTFTLGMFLSALYKLGLRLDSDFLGMNLWGWGGVILLVACVTNFGVFGINQTSQEFANLMEVNLQTLLTDKEDRGVAALFFLPAFIFAIWFILSIWNFLKLRFS